MDLLVVTFHIKLKFACKCIAKVLFPLTVFHLHAVNLYVRATLQYLTSLCVVVVIGTIRKASFTWTKPSWSNVTGQSFQ